MGILTNKMNHLLKNEITNNLNFYHNKAKNKKHLLYLQSIIAIYLKVNSKEESQGFKLIKQ